MTDRCRDAPWLMRTYSATRRRRRRTSCTGRTWPRARPGCRSPSTCRRRPATTPTRRWRAARSARSACPVVHLGHMRTLLDGIPPGADEHVDDDQRHRGVAARRSTSPTPRSRASPSAALRGTTQNDIVKEYLSRGHVHLPARAVAPADRRHGRLVRRARARVEPDERVLVPPAGGRRDAGAGARLRAGDGDRRARRRARLGAGRAGAVRAGVRLDLVLRQRRHPLRRGDLQAAGVHRDVGPHRARALRRRRPEGPPLPLRRAGQQPRPHRGAAGEQRPAHRARDARR